jgi:hypothetical protein
MNYKPILKNGKLDRGSVTLLYFPSKATKQPGSQMAGKITKSNHRPIPFSVHFKNQFLNYTKKQLGN